MSTNYYARIRLGDSKSIETTIKLHIGKTGRGTIVSGDWFPSFAEWKKFLEFNEDKTVIVDEYEQELTVEELVKRFENFDYAARRRQYDAVSEQHAEHLEHYWLDADGHTMCKGDFS